MIELDARWLDANPLPPLGEHVSKKSRGRLLVVGGAHQVPGALRLTGEAALRVGAGKVQIATVPAAAIPLGVLFPEAGVIALAEQDGELVADPPERLTEAARRNEAVVLGPGISDQDAASRLVRVLADDPAPETALLLDASAVACAGPLCDLLGCYAGRLVMTPHEGEMAALCGRDMAEVQRDPARIATEIAQRFQAVISLKGEETVVAAPDGALLHYPGGGPGLATGGSGDVLAGVIGGLLARGAEPLIAAGWGVWLHGEAGRALGARMAPLGFLARELLPELPALAAR